MKNFVNTIIRVGVILLITLSISAFLFNTNSFTIANTPASSSSATIETTRKYVNNMTYLIFYIHDPVSGDLHLSVVNLTLDELDYKLKTMQLKSLK